MTSSTPKAPRIRIRADVHYRVVQATDHVASLSCMWCDFFVKPRLYHKSGDRSGLGRYNRARAVMVKHLYSEHRALVTEGGAS